MGEELRSIAQVLQALQTTQAALTEQLQRQSEQIELNRQSAAQEIGILREQSQTQAEALIAAAKARERRPGVVDVKGVGKPDTLKGKPDTVRKEWVSWAYTFSVWFGSQFENGAEILEWARDQRESITSDMLEATSQQYEEVK